MVSVSSKRSVNVRNALHESSLCLLLHIVVYSKEERSACAQAEVARSKACQVFRVTRRHEVRGETKRETDTFSVLLHHNTNFTVHTFHLRTVLGLVVYAVLSGSRCPAHLQQRHSASLSATADHPTLAGRSPRVCLVGS